MIPQLKASKIEIEVKDNTHDIKIYIHSKFETLILEIDLKVHNKSVYNEIVKKLVRKVGKM